MIITIEGVKCECERGEYLLQVARRNDIFVPTLCYHEGLGSLGACRLCIVEVVSGGRSQVAASCLYPVEHEIEVFVNSDKIKEERGVILALLSRLAPNAKAIQQMAKHIGADLPRLTDKDGGDTCILCGRCATACELVGSGAIAKINRGAAKAIGTPYDQPSPECIGCTGCAQVCPTESIPYTETDTTVTIWGRTFDLKRCICCGRPVSTDEMIAGIWSKEAADGATADDAALCAACRKAAVAVRINAGARVLRV
ncbi:MAG: 2Fe-2S iron-sulfur cluster-binding protein [Clostridiales bacterium]|nr:2Fe-2S iron-sulfur cluster-binding protein [Clostridiales bacterium]